MDQIKAGVVVSGPILPEPVRGLAAESPGAAVNLIGQGLNANLKDNSLPRANPEKSP